jgi:hypothetical protein
VEREAEDLRRLNKMLEDEIKLIREEHVPVTMQVGCATGVKRHGWHYWYLS